MTHIPQLYRDAADLIRKYGFVQRAFFGRDSTSGEDLEVEPSGYCLIGAVAAANADQKFPRVNEIVTVLHNPEIINPLLRVLGADRPDVGRSTIGKVTAVQDAPFFNGEDAVRVLELAAENVEALSGPTETTKEVGT